jgi:hypothetical protein
MQVAVPRLRQQTLEVPLGRRLTSRVLKLYYVLDDLRV